MATSQQPQLLRGCRVCGSMEGLLRCSNCKAAFYCSQTHQQSDWRNHRPECRIISKSSGKIACNNNTVKASNIVNDAMRAKQSTGGAPRLANRQDPPQRNNLEGGSSLLPAEGSNEQDIISVIAETIETGDNLPETASHSTTNQNEREHNQRDFKRIAENTMQINDINLLNQSALSSEMRYDDLCQHIISDLNKYGLSVIDDFLGRHKGLEILNEVHDMYAANLFQNGQLVSKTVAESELKTIRGDKITWVRGTESGCINIGYLINQIDNVVISANKMPDNGLVGNYTIRERTKAMVACYPGSGSQYVMHVDNPNSDGRVITAIYYLNLDWDAHRSGGNLRIIPEHGGGTAANIEPKFDRIIFFWSDRRNPHEVQPAHRTRYAITVWYFDAVEREQALYRFRQYNPDHKLKT